LFTGIIEEIGHVEMIKGGKNCANIKIKAKKVLEKTRLGDSISVNGVCLTVTHLDKDTFSVDVMHETMMHSDFCNLKAGDMLNLERAMALGDRFGGHIVSGHIDGIGKIRSIQKDLTAYRYRILTSERIAGQIVLKGSITIDGISLTVTDVDKDSFEVSIIPHTMNNTILFMKKIGDLVNLENDIIGKYIAKFLMGNTKDTNKGLSMDSLLRNGFI
jgi:riboflavin synthase